MTSNREVTIGSVDADEFPDFLGAFKRTFGDVMAEDAVQRLGDTVEHDRLVAARSVDGDIVGTAGNYTFDISLPGAAPAGCAGVTIVSVRADYRRRGLLTRMMAELLDDAAARGEPFSALWASESPIYGRFGFGPAAPTLQFTVERQHARLRFEGPVAEVALVGFDQAAERFPAIYESVRAGRHGMMSRSPAWWTRYLADVPSRREGAGPYRYAILDDRGYALHRLRPSWDDGAPNGTVEVQDLVATDPEAGAALWGFLFDTDLAAKTVAGRRPIDDPLVAMLADPVRARPEVDWPLYLRLVDVPAALEARGYAAEDTLTLGVHDRLRPANDGVWRLEVRDGKAACLPGTGDVDVELDVQDLAAVSLGGVRPTSLADAGRIVAADREAVARLGRLLATDVAPWQGGMF